MSQNDALKQARAALFKIPAHEYFEVPGKADVLYELRDYSLDPERGAEKARLDIPFLFKPFEVGQKPPSSKGRELHFGREPTIHEYLDWTVTAATLDTLVQILEISVALLSLGFFGISSTDAFAEISSFLAAAFM